MRRDGREATPHSPHYYGGTHLQALLHAGPALLPRLGAAQAGGLRLAREQGGVRLELQGAGDVLDAGPGSPFRGLARASGRRGGALADESERLVHTVLVMGCSLLGASLQPLHRSTQVIRLLLGGLETSGLGLLQRCRGRF